MIKDILLPVLSLSFSPSYGATLYQWFHKNGTYNFADDLEKVLPKHQNHVHVRVVEDAPEVMPLVLPPKFVPQRYEAQVAEAREGLENVLKKTEESKFDPNWVRQ